MKESQVRLEMLNMRGRMGMKIAKFQGKNGALLALKSSNLPSLSSSIFSLDSGAMSTRRQKRSISVVHRRPVIQLHAARGPIIPR